jgi:methionine S-methyltransferase
VKIKVVQTYFDDSFKISPEQLKKSIDGVKNPFLFLNFPLVNPTGALYTEKDCEELFDLLISKNVFVIFDTVFSGLEFNGINKIDLSRYVDKGLKYVLIGGISKEFSAGGLRFGFATTADAQLKKNIEKYVLDKPHTTIIYTANLLYKLLNENNSSLIIDLKKQQSTLQERYLQLSNVLLNLGWKVLPTEGGLFLVAKPEKYIGKKVQVQGKEVLINCSNINEALFYNVGLLINNDVWTGIPGYCRLVLSVDQDTFTDALNKLRKFDELIY